MVLCDLTTITLLLVVELEVPCINATTMLLVILVIVLLVERNLCISTKLEVLLVAVVLETGSTHTQALP